MSQYSIIVFLLMNHYKNKAKIQILEAVKLNPNIVG